MVDSVVGEEAGCNDEALNLRGALIDLSNACVPVMPLGAHIADVPHASKNLYPLPRTKTDVGNTYRTTPQCDGIETDLMGDEGSSLAGSKLGHGCLLGVVDVVVLV